MSFRFLGEPFFSRFLGHPVGTLPQAGGAYSAKVLNLSPIAYWPLWEASGGTAEDISGNDRDATAIGVTWGQDGIGDGRTAPYFDGVNDYINIRTASLLAAWSWTAYSILAWIKPTAAAWTDGNIHYVFSWVVVFNTNHIIIRKTTTNNQLNFNIAHAGTIDQITYNTSGPSDFVPIVLTVDENAGATGEMKAYLGGAQIGATQTGIGTGAGDANPGVLGSFNTGPFQAWLGHLAHVALFDYALTATQVARVSSL